MKDRPPVARRASPWADALFSALAHGAAWLTLALLAGIIVSLVIGAAPAIRAYGLVVPLDQRVGPGAEPLRRPGDDLRHAGDLAHRAAHRRAGELRHRALPDRAVAALAEAPARHRDRAARGGALDRLRHVGPARVRPDPVALRPAAAAVGVQGRAAARLAVLRAAGRHRPAVGRHHPGDHDHPVHRLGDARRLRGDAADAEGVGLRARLDDLGGRLEGRAAVHQDRRRRRHHARASAARSARPWR